MENERQRYPGLHRSCIGQRCALANKIPDMIYPHASLREARGEVHDERSFWKEESCFKIRTVNVSKWWSHEVPKASFRYSYWDRYDLGVSRVSFDDFAPNSVEDLFIRYVMRFKFSLTASMWKFDEDFGKADVNGSDAVRTHSMRAESAELYCSQLHDR